MPMTLHFKRAKSFVIPSDNDNGERKYLGMPGPTPDSRVPFWVATTPTFKQGILDKSIVNLTPPEDMPGYKPIVQAPESEEEADAAALAASEAEALDDQKEVPQAEFGGQPMTPVAPAPRVGGITPGAKRNNK